MSGTLQHRHWVWINNILCFGAENLSCFDLTKIRIMLDYKR